MIIKILRDTPFGKKKRYLLVESREPIHALSLRYPQEMNETYDATRPVTRTARNDLAYNAAYDFATKH